MVCAGEFALCVPIDSWCGANEWFLMSSVSLFLGGTALALVWFVVCAGEFVLCVPIDGWCGANEWFLILLMPIWHIAR